MANLQIKAVPEDVHDELRRRAEQAGMTVRDYVLDLIRRDQSLPSLDDWLTSLATLKPVATDESVVAHLDETRRSRGNGRRR